MIRRRGVLWAGILALSLGLAGPRAAVAADLYAYGQLSMAFGLGDSGGSADPGGGNTFYFTGDDFASGAVGTVGVGYAFPLSEAFPYHWDTDLPDWPVRAEFEALVGRDQNFVTGGGGDRWLTSLTSYAVMQNFWLDLPVASPLERWIGRVPLLDPMTFNLGGGVGLGYTEISTTNNAIEGGKDALHFVWQVGGGVGYQLTDRVWLNLGYRFVSLGEFSYTMKVPPSTAVGRFSLDVMSHELAAGIRVNFTEVPSPGAWTFRRGR